ncbi:MAG: hypothetical protein IJN91_02590 [Alphaproteobacteria bacterium]|nr:hypothetical protein [Alphaproteobacteria bacterium]
MTNWTASLIDNTIQCWGCSVFDRLFQIVSIAAAAIYDYFSMICVVLFCAIFTVFVVNSIYANFKSDFSDPWYKNSIQKVFISGIVALGIMGAGITFPRVLSTITFEPVAQMTLSYTQYMTQQTDADINARVTYTPTEMSDDSFFRPQLRDKIIMIMKTTVTQFQSYMKLGIAVMDSAFSWQALLGIGALIKHIVLFFIGLALTIGFFRLFFKYCCYFVDVIMSMALFAFFFPLSLAVFPFQGISGVPEWAKNLGGSVGTKQIKSLINSIVTLGSVVITYTVIMMIVANFFTATDGNINELMTAITTGEIFEFDLNTENLAAMTLMSCTVLMYVLNYIYGQIPQITKMILSAFNVDEKKDLGEKLGEDLIKFGKIALDKVTQTGKTIISGGKKDGE